MTASRRATLTVPADADAARLVRLLAGAIAVAIGLEGDALDDVRHVAGELVDSLVSTTDGSLTFGFDVVNDGIVVRGDVEPPPELRTLLDADSARHLRLVTDDDA